VAQRFTALGLQQKGLDFIRRQVLLASCLLSLASCLLPLASCLLPAAYYLLPLRWGFSRMAWTSFGARSACYVASSYSQCYYRMCVLNFSRMSCFSHHTIITPLQAEGTDLTPLLLAPHVSPQHTCTFGLPPNTILTPSLRPRNLR
jgi:hypothetical protein